MSDGYRDELSAALARIEELEAENERLRMPPPAELTARLAELRQQRALLATGYDQGRKNVRLLSHVVLLAGVVGGVGVLFVHGVGAGLGMMAIAVVYRFLANVDGGWGKRITRLDDQIAALEKPVSVSMTSSAK